LVFNGSTDLGGMGLDSYLPGVVCSIRIKGVSAVPYLCPEAVLDFFSISARFVFKMDILLDPTKQEPVA